MSALLPAVLISTRSWLRGRRYITPITAICNNAGTHELLPPPATASFNKSKKLARIYAGTYKASRLFTPAPRRNYNYNAIVVALRW